MGCPCRPLDLRQTNLQAGWRGEKRRRGKGRFSMRRREFVINLGLAGAWPLVAQAQQATPGGAVTDFVRPGAMLKRARTKTLEIAYEESGPESGLPVLLMH